MGSMSRRTALALVLVMVMSNACMLLIQPVNAQTTPTVSVPEFSVKFVDSSYNIPANTSIDPFTGKTVTTPAQYINNQTIELSIKNQTIPNETYLYYEIRMKGHYSQDWTNISFVQANPRSEYTILTYAIDGNNAPDQFTSHLNQISSGGTADFQVQAQIMEYNTFPYSQSIPVFAVISESDWTPTQTITIPASSISPNPTLTSTPTVPEFPAIAVLTILVTVFSFAMLIRLRTQKRKS
jgi:hypothetical protein